MDKKIKRGYGQILISAVLWGMIPLFTKLLYKTGLNPMQVASVRGYLAAILALGLLILHKDYKKFHSHEIPFYLFYGACAIGGSFILYAVSMGMLSTAMAAVLLYTGPAFVNILNRILYKMPITLTKLAALILTFLGCALVVEMYDLTSFKSNLIGILVGLCSGFCYSLTTVLGTNARKLHTGEMNGRLILIFGAVVFCIVQPPWMLPTLNTYQLVLCFGLAVVCSVLPYTMYLTGMDCGIDGGVASIMATIEPVAATLFGVWIFRENLSLLQVLGIMIVLLGVILPFISPQMGKSHYNDKKKNR